MSVPTDTAAEQAGIELGGWLRARRRQQGLSQDQAARALGCTQAAISQLERGSIRHPSLDRVDALLRLYDVPEPDRTRLLGLCRQARDTTPSPSLPPTTPPPPSLLWPPPRNNPVAGQPLTNLTATLDRRVRDGETLADVGAHYGVSRERIRQLVSVDAAKCGSAVRRALKNETRRVTAEVASVQTALTLGPCVICWGPVTTLKGKKAGKAKSVRFPTCGTRCRLLWLDARLHLAPEYREAHRRSQAMWNLLHSTRPVVLEHSARVLAEGVPANRQYVQKGSRADLAVQETRRLRQATLDRGETWWLRDSWPDQPA